jgi:copper chaperone CopZ
MKKLIILIAILIGNFAYSQVKTIEIFATGLTCSMCSKATYNKLKTLPNIDSIATNLETTSFILYLKANTNTSLELVKNKIEAAGFAVGSILVTMDIATQKLGINSKLVVGGDTFYFTEKNITNANGIIKFKVFKKGFLTEKEFKKSKLLYKKYPQFATPTLHNFCVEIVNN